MFAALDVSQEQMAVCVVDAGGAILAEGKVAACPDAIAAWLAQWPGATRRVGAETGPIAVWLWNALAAMGLPIVRLDARHAHGVLKMMPNKTDRHDARGLAQIVRTGWFEEVRIKSHGACVARAPLSARAALTGRPRPARERDARPSRRPSASRRAKRVGGFARRAEEIIREELAPAPELRPILKALVAARRAILERLRALEPSCAPRPAGAASCACS